MALEVGDKVHHVMVSPGAYDTTVDAVGPCTDPNHLDGEGGPCDQTAVTVNDPLHNQPFTAHEDQFAKIED